MLETAFNLLGAQVSWLELLAFFLALGCVGLSVLEIHWGWPLAIASSLLYWYLFKSFRLYGEAGLQLFFALIAAWGWWQWLCGRRDTDRQGSPPGLTIARLALRRRLLMVLAWGACWLLLGMLLTRFTDSDVPWFDAFATAGSVVGQVLLARKLLENWGVWIVVNLWSVLLFAYKGLWLTALLYLVFAALAYVGLLRWRATFNGRLAAPVGESGGGVGRAVGG